MQGLLERLAEGPVIGDGGFVFAMEKRGYVKAGPWTPEVVMEHPEAGIFFYMIYFSCKNLCFKKNSRCIKIYF